ncbi:MAG TPA: squalene/phytoene synthase family protein [Vicinamibacterales bacterium]|nr:squalene/phytoene synthase family protein [Vicinamibacterales bacterium]
MRNESPNPGATLLAERFAPETLGGAPILELAARLWEPDRYEAFRACYRAMRLVDDLVDDSRSGGRLACETEKAAIRREVVRCMLDDGDPGLHIVHLREVRERFAIPRWPWERWTRAMLYDVDHDGFPSFREYLRYAEGAAVAPGAIFLHLCGLRRENGGYRPPAFDIRRTARPLAIFCYLVHIMRDFRTDQLEDLNYFPDRLLAVHGLTRRDLRAIARSGEIPPAFRRLLGEYRAIAGFYGRRARAAVDGVADLLGDRYRASLEVVYALYHQVFERIRPHTGALTAEEFLPTGDEMRLRLEAILAGLEAEADGRRAET